MGWVVMSERDLNRVEVLAQVDDGRLSVDNATNMLDLTRRQIFRLLKRYRQDGASAIRHKARGKPPNNRIHHAKRDYALSLIKESYADFGPTLAAEMLTETSRVQSLARDGSQVDAGRRPLVVTQAAPDIPPAAAASGMLRRVDPDRRLGSPVV